MPIWDLNELAHSGKRAVVDILSLLESDQVPQDMAALLDAATAAPRGHVLGITGPPGVGKSTLTRALISHYRSQKRSVAIVAVDPSSRLTGGALLGDRARMKSDPDDRHLLIRSLAARDRLGGLSDKTLAMVALLRALYDEIIVETVGVGQSEADVTMVADAVLLCVQPGSGDSLQFMKAGIMEIPDLVCVTKADLGAAAKRAVADVEGALSLTAPVQGDKVPVLAVSAPAQIGLDQLFRELAHMRARYHEAGLTAARRKGQAEVWLSEAVELEYGRRGRARIDVQALLANHSGPFSALIEAGSRLDP